VSVKSQKEVESGVQIKTELLAQRYKQLEILVGGASWTQKHLTKVDVHANLIDCHAVCPQRSKNITLSNLVLQVGVISSGMLASLH
jgi:hypothetical protein